MFTQTRVESSGRLILGIFQENHTQTEVDTLQEKMCDTIWGSWMGGELITEWFLRRLYTLVLFTYGTLKIPDSTGFRLLLLSLMRIPNFSDTINIFNIRYDTSVSIFREAKTLQHISFLLCVRADSLILPKSYLKSYTYIILLDIISQARQV